MNAKTGRTWEGIKSWNILHEDVAATKVETMTRAKESLNQAEWT